MMDGGYYPYYTTPITTTTTTTTTATFSSLESSGSDQYMEGTDFEVSDFFSNFEDWGMGEGEGEGERETHNDHHDECYSMAYYNGQNQSFGYQGGSEFYEQLGESSINQNEGDGHHDRGGSRNVREKKDMKGRIAFRMRSEVDVVEDGYKWRKYGKKMVKNSPNPRNYYRCSIDSCPVKKRVERDKDDPNYVITTYEGIHNHETPRQ